MTPIGIIKEGIKFILQNETVRGGASLVLISWASGKLATVSKDLWKHVDRRLRHVVYIDDVTEMYKAFEDWLLEHYPEEFRRMEIKMKREHDNGLVRFLLKKSHYDDTIIIKYGGKFIWISKTKDTLEGAGNANNRYVNTYMLTCALGKNVLAQLMEEVRGRWEAKHGRYKGLRVVVKDRWADFCTRYLKSYKKIDQVFIDGKEDLKRDIMNFFAMQEFYAKHAIKFKRTYLFYGPPGTGKTTLVFAIADWLNRPIYFLNPAGFGS